MRNRIRLLLLWVLSPFGVLAQQPRLPCATVDLTVEQHQLINKQAAQALARKRASNAAFATITYVPIRPHILRKSDGSGGISVATINQVIALTNSYYLLNGFGIQFYFCGTSPDYVDNDAQYASFSDENAVTQGHDGTNAMNQYYVNSFASGIGGYGYYPADGISSTRSFIINEVGHEDDMGNRLIPHELGHNFDLVHTFGTAAGNGPLGSGVTLELVTRDAGANCATEGDYICDTPADPFNKAGASLIYVNGCVHYDLTSSARDANGEAYTPSVENIMSYYNSCTHAFTPGQYERMQGGLALRQTHTAYSLDCPPALVAAPSQFTATSSDGPVVLTWQDNASNEMGYFIERSLSISSGFLPIGGVGPDATTFTDLKASPLLLYYYRIRPSNATTTGLSQVIAIRTPFCHSVFRYACSDPVGLASLAVNGVLLSQNSGCSPNGYGRFATSTTVVAGQSCPLSGTFLDGLSTQGVTVWVDLNRNGRYETLLGERLFRTFPTVTGKFSGSLPLPSWLMPGALSLRVVTAANLVPNEPCGAYDYGETEDYLLNVVSPPAADLSLVVQISTRILVVDQPVSYSVTLHNDGPDPATGISWQNRLPPNLLFVQGDASVINSGTAVGGQNLSLGSGTSATFVFQLQPTQPGTFVSAAQLMTGHQADPDSQPGSGTGDGQDDTATVDARTAFNNDIVYGSPNPNQTPLPAVGSNQPTPDPAQADLSLAMAVSARTPLLGQLITFTITVSNGGGLAATNIVVRDTLRGLTFHSSATGVQVVNKGPGYTILEGRVGSLAAGDTTPLIFRATTTLSGHLTNGAQLWSADQTDPDSTPGSVTPTANNLNGEDDVALTDLRVGLP